MSETSQTARWGWLSFGLVLGAAVTAGLVFAVSMWLGSDQPGTEASGSPLFAAVSSGPDHAYDGDFEHFVGGGVAVFDCDQDSMPDLYFAGGSESAGLFVNVSVPGGDLTFVPLPNPTTDLLGVTGAYPIDIDSDTIDDLVVLRHGENKILRGTGDCQFEDGGESWGIGGGDEWTVGFSAFWDDADSMPTLAFGNYLRLDDPDTGSQCEDHFLFRPDANGIYGEPETLTPGYCTLSILFSDWGRSGQPDLRMTNDRHYYAEGHEQLWAMAAGPGEYTSTQGWNDLEIWGMGIASQDLDGDGYPEVFLTSQGDNKLQSLTDDQSRPDYDDVALAAGVTAHRPFAGDTLRPSTAWHAEFDDVNNDGRVDLFVTKGNVEAQVDFAAKDPNNLLLGQADGTFVEGAEEAGLLDLARSRGGAVVDLNLDGQLDIVVVERREPVKIWQNTGLLVDGSDTGSWLLIDIGQEGPNSDAIGAWIEVDAGDRLITKETTIGGGHASGELGWTHFGLGPVDEARVRVTWPDGETTEWETIAANQMIVWDRGSDPIPWTSPAD